MVSFHHVVQNTLPLSLQPNSGFLGLSGYVNNKFLRLCLDCCKEFLVIVKLLLLSTLKGKDNPTYVLGSKSTSLILLKHIPILLVSSYLTFH